MNFRDAQRLLSVLTIAIGFTGAHSFAQTTVTNDGKVIATTPFTIDASIAHKVDSVLALMTLEEKLGQLNQISGPGRDPLQDDDKALIRKGLLGSFLNLVGPKNTRAAQAIAVNASRLQIPLLFGLDIIHGMGTTFPIPLAEAATWDVQAVEHAARIAATEGTAAGIHWTFAPMVDIARDPRWGRIAEGAGEDPFLGSMLAAARVRGFQGSDFSDPTTLLACAKHFAAYGGAEGGRDYNTVDMSERTLREVYLPPYKAAVDAGAVTLMASFNEIGGVPSSANRWLLTEVPRQEWGFAGFVVSDWTSILELMAHGIAATRGDAGRLALTAGVDMDMEAQIYQNDLAALVREQKLSEDVVNEAVRRVLAVKFKLGLFDNPYRNCDPTREKSDLLTPANKAFARAIAQKAIVLLKNADSLLPLRKDLKTIAVIGPLAADREAPLGPWAGDGRPENVVSVLQGIKNKVGAQAKILHAQGCGVSDSSRTGFAPAVRLAKQADIVVLVVGESQDMSGEAASRATLSLPGVQEELVQAIAATAKPVVMVVMNGRPLVLSWPAAHVPAIVEAWFLGLEHGNAVADVLFGEVNPSGKLPVTFPRTVGQVPIYYNHKSTGRPASPTEKFTSKYIDSPSTPLYPFGYGLSYTRFSYRNLRLSADAIRPNGVLQVSVDVENTGKMAGDEVVQLYVQDEVASVTRPVKELQGFQRITLAAGETRTVTFTLNASQLAFYNQEMQHVVEPGMFMVYVGGNSTEVLSRRFAVVEE